MNWKTTDVTELLHQWQSGDLNPEAAFFGEVCTHLRSMAEGLASRERNVTSETLLQDAWLVISRQHNPFENRRNFLAICSRIMRRVLVDLARSKKRLKRGGDQITITLDAAPDVAQETMSVDVFLDLEAAMNRLEKHNPEYARLTEMKIYGQLTVREIAEETGLSKSTVSNRLAAARANLHEFLYP